MDPNQIKIDDTDHGDMDEMEHEWIRERKPYNAEYSAREEYKAKFKPHENDTWKIDYFKTKDSNGKQKPSYMGLDDKGNPKTIGKMPTKGIEKIKP